MSPSIIEEDTADFQLTGVLPTQRKYELSENINSVKIQTQRPFFPLMAGRIFHAWGGDTENCLLLQEEGVYGLFHHHRQQHVYQHPSVKNAA